MMKRLVCCILAIIILYALCGCASEPVEVLSEEELWAINCCRQLQNILKDPDSFRIYADALIIEYKNSEAPEAYLILDYGAKNGYGGMERELALFDQEYGYLGDYEKEAYNTSNKKAKLAFSEAQFSYSSYTFPQRDGGPNPNYNSRTVSRELIEKQLGLSKG